MAPKIRLTHTGLSQGPIRLDDVDFGFEQQNRKVQAYVPFGGSIEILYTDKTSYSHERGDINGFVESGHLEAVLLGFGIQDFSTNIITIAGSYSLTQNIIQRYDASATLPDSIVLGFPSSPIFNDTFGVKEVGNSGISILLDGNGNLVEGVGFPPMVTQSIGITLISLFFKWDGSVWRII